MTRTGPHVQDSNLGLPRIRRDTIVRGVAPITVKRCGVGATWSVLLGPSGHFWLAGGRTVWTEDEARADAEQAVRAVLEPYRARIPAETEITFEEFLQLVGVRDA